MNIDLSDLAIVSSINGNQWLFKAILYGKQKSIGYALCEARKTKLRIMDIKIDNAYRNQRSFPKVLLDFLFSRSVNFRRMGIGTRLLQTIIAEAKQRMFSEIWTSVTKKNIDKNHFLIDWYKKQGFRIENPDAECPGGSVKKIRLLLQNPASKQTVGGKKKRR